MTTSTSLNLRALLKTAITRSGMDVPADVVSGLTPSAKAFFIASTAHAMPHGVVLYVVPGDGDLEQTVSDIGFFLSALEGLSATAADRAVLPFPSHEIDPYRGLAPHAGVTSARARALHAIADGRARVVVASAAALLPRVSAPDRLLASSIELRPGEDIAPGDLGAMLVDAGFSREDPADEHGEFAIRGGILDVFPAGEAQPVRIEYIGDTIESLRTYDPATQRSVHAIDQIEIVPLRDILVVASQQDHSDHPESTGDRSDRSATLFDYLARAKESRIILSESDEVEAHLVTLSEQIQRSYEDVAGGTGVASPAELFADWDDLEARIAHATNLTQLGLDDDAPVAPGQMAGVPSSAGPRTTPATLSALPALHVRCQPSVEMHGRVADWVAEIRRLRSESEATLFVAATPGRAERTIELLKDYDLLAVPVERAEDARYAAVLVAVGHLSRGFRLPEAGLQVYAEADVFEEERRAPERRRSANKAFLSDLRDLKIGDLVVHVDHGIGTFVGLKQIGVADTAQEFLELRYAGDDKLFVPVERLDLIQKYSGATRPPLDRLGGASWERQPNEGQEGDARRMAEELLNLAARKAVPRHAFSPDSHWRQELRTHSSTKLTRTSGTVPTSSATWNRADADGPTALRRRRLRQDRRSPCGLPSKRDGRQTGRVPADDGAGISASEDVGSEFAGFPGASTRVSGSVDQGRAKESLSDRRPAKWTSWSARTDCCQRTSNSGPRAAGRGRDSGSGWPTKKGSSS